MNERSGIDWSAQIDIALRRRAEAVEAMEEQARWCAAQANTCDVRGLVALIGRVEAWDRILDAAHDQLNAALLAQTKGAE